MRCTQVVTNPAAPSCVQLSIACMPVAHKLSKQTATSSTQSYLLSTTCRTLHKQQGRGIDSPIDFNSSAKMAQPTKSVASAASWSLHRSAQPLKQTVNTCNPHSNNTWLCASFSSHAASLSARGSSAAGRRAQRCQPGEPSSDARRWQGAHAHIQAVHAYECR